jgi:imipenem/basic amino acid-specific outer membrane pore
MKSIKLSLVAALTCLFAVSANAQELPEAQNFSEIFTKAKTSGEIRLGYVAQDNEDNTKNKNGAAGGHLAIETASLNGISFGTAFYTTNTLQSKDIDTLGTSLFNSNDKSYAILGQAYINVSLDKTNLKVGRQQIDTPFIDSDDIRMIPNLFEAYMLSNNDIEDLILTAAHVSKWSGVDAVTPEKFQKLVESGNGATMLGATYSGIKESELSAWYYDINDFTKIAYLTASTKLGLSDGATLNLAAQYANFSEYSVNGAATNIDGNVWGASAELAFESIGTTFSTAYNKSSNKAGKSVSNGFGGGPFSTSMEENTIDSLEGAKAYVAGISFDFSTVGVDGLSLAYAKGKFRDSLTTSHVEIDESDYTLEYSYNDNLSAVLLYTDAKTKTDGIVNSDDTTFKRIQAYANYKF